MNLYFFICIIPSTLEQIHLSSNLKVKSNCQSYEKIKIPYYIDYTNSCFENCLFFSNDTLKETRQIYIRYSEISFINCQFSNFVFDVYVSNVNNHYGGIIYTYSSNLLFSFCNFKFNYIYSNSGNVNEVEGGLVRLETSNSNFSNCFFCNNRINTTSDNVNDNNGDIIFIRSSNTTINSCYFTHNEITIDSDNSNTVNGGIIYIDSSNSSFNSCFFTDNFLIYKDPDCYGALIELESESKSLPPANVFFNKCYFNNNSLNKGMLKRILNLNGVIIHSASSSRFVSTRLIYRTCSYFNDCVFTDESSELETKNSITGKILYLDNSDSSLNNCSFYSNQLKEFINYKFNCMLYFMSSNINLSFCKFYMCVQNDGEFNSLFVRSLYSNCSFDFCDFLFTDTPSEITIKEKKLNYLIYSTHKIIINNCFFEVNNSDLYKDKSTIYLSVVGQSIITNFTEFHQFINNSIQIRSPNKIVVFGGGNGNFSDNKWMILNNCIYPYSNDVYKNENMYLYDEDGINILKFEDGFPIDCNPKTTYFSMSSKFSESKKFTSSCNFKPSNSFSKSFGFTQSKFFSSSNRFTQSYSFSQSDDFTQSEQFSQSLNFTPSLFFSKSNTFSQSTYFTKSDLFSQSKNFTQSFYFSRSNYFSQSAYLTKSNIFSQSNKFTNSYYFTNSNLFPKSNCFTKSANNNRSNLFSIENKHFNIYFRSNSFINITINFESTVTNNHIFISNSNEITSFLHSNYNSIITFSSENMLNDKNSGVFNDPVGSPKRKNKTTIIVVIIIIVVVILAICIAIIFFILKKNKKSKNEDSKNIAEKDDTTFIENQSNSVEIQSFNEEEDEDLNFWL